MVTISPASEKTSRIRFTLNGEQTDVSFASYKTLLEVLREDLNHTGTKHGCELGECGACAVLLDGKPILSCLFLAVECDARDIQTVEGLGANGALHPLQEAFADLGAAQCGYCTPAILGALNSTVLWFNPQGPLSPDAVAETFANYLVRGLCSSRASARKARPGRSLARSAITLSKKFTRTGDPQW